LNGERCFEHIQGGRFGSSTLEHSQELPREFERESETIGDFRHVGLISELVFRPRVQSTPSLRTPRSINRLRGVARAEHMGHQVTAMAGHMKQYQVHIWSKLSDLAELSCDTVQGLE
jgi:hypothetical protein